MNVCWPLPRLTFRELGSTKESRPTALLAQSSAWAVARRQLNLPLVIQAEPNRNDREFFDYLGHNLPSLVEVIYAVGDGVPLDAAKYVAQVSGKPLVIVPTALSGDKPFTCFATINENGLPKDVETGPAAEVVIDFDLIKIAPSYQRAAAIVDVLSIITALMDWGYAAQKNMTTPETRFVPWATAIGANLASQALKSAAAIGKGDTEALRLLLDLLCMTVQLDNQLGHRRVSHGTEHLFARAIKPATAGDVSYAERVAPGILLTSALYNKDATGLRAALESAGLQLGQLQIDDIRATLNTLPDYAHQVSAPYSILNDLKSNADELYQALAKSTLLPVAKSA